MKRFKFQSLVVLLIALYTLIVVDAAPTPDTTSDFLINNCTEQGTIAITMDDGPRSFTHELLNQLKERNVKATFFMNGHSFEEHCIYDYADVVKRAYDEGHQVGSHTWSHLGLTTVSLNEFDYQLKTLEVAFKKIIGAVPTYLRPPYGDQNETVQSLLKERGYKMVLWNGDTFDYKEDLQAAVRNFTDIVSKSPPPNSLMVLNHDRVSTTSFKLGAIEADLALKNGYKVTTVGGCTGKPNKEDWYKEIGKPQERDISWRCTPEDMHLPPPAPLPAQPDQSSTVDQPAAVPS